MHPMLNTAIKAARKAGSVMLQASRKLDQITVESKGRNDLVSEVDRAVEAAIVEILQEAYPKHSILAEEGGRYQRKGNDQAEYLWIIDPLDGTSNYLHGKPFYCTSIALQQEGKITQAVVFEPEHNNLFTASRGGGAFLNDRRIRVSRQTQLLNSLIGTGIPSRDLTHLPPYLECLQSLIHKGCDIRATGAAALNLAYVAAGWYDGFFEFGLGPWDMAAGSLLIHEAGGLSSDFSGEANGLDNGQMLAGCPKVFGQLLRAIEPYAARLS